MKKILVLFMLLMSIKSFGQLPSYVSKDSLKAWFPFNGNAKDESGNGNNGKDSNVTLTTDRNGNSNSAYDFNGTTSNIYIGNLHNLNMYKSNFTISVWIDNMDSSTSQRMILGKDSTCYGNQGQFRLLFGEGGNCTAVGNFALGESGVNGLCFNPSKFYKSWNFITAIKSDTTGLLYWNGKLVSSQHWDTTGASGFKNYDCYIGARLSEPKKLCSSTQYHGLCNFFLGKIDDVGIWARALDSSEVLNLYNGCVGINITNQPANQNLLKGKNAMFVVSSSYAGASYQWQTDKGTGFVNLSNAGQYNGATNDTLIISGVSSSNDGQKFRCIASSGSVCKDTSKIATLTVCPAITTQPSNQSVTEGRSATFIAASADVNATYQWQTDQGTGYANLSNAGQYSGAKNDTLTVSNTTLSNNNQNFRCIVKSGSSCIDTTTIAVLDVSVKNGINENHNNVGFALYPNPANNRINVKSDVSLVGSAYSITDVVGKVVMSGKLSAVNSIISIENLPNGEYIFKLGNKSNQSFKIIKE